METFRPPYLSFQTFWTFLADLATKPLPPKIDRSLMSSKSGTDQNNLLAALLAFGFVEDDNKVTHELQTFVEADDSARQEILADLIKQKYAIPLAVSNSNGTSTDLTAAFRDDLGMSSADTRRKAITFFLHAARQADVPLSPHFPKTRSGSGSPGTPKPRKVRRKSVEPANGSGDPGSVNAPPTHTVRLLSGGTVTLTYDVNLFEVTDDDQRFVLDLIKSLRNYRNVAADPDDAQGAT